MQPLIDADIPYEYRDGGLYWVVPKGGRTIGRRVGSVNSMGYRHFTLNNKIYLEHRKIWEMFNPPIPKGMMIDHIDRDRLNNLLSNLRLVTPKGNQQNQEGRGYSWDRSCERWKARIVVNKKFIHLGNFLCEDEARQCYLTAKRKYHDFYTA